MYLNNGPFEGREYLPIVKFFLDFVERFWLYSGFGSTLSCGGPYLYDWLEGKSDREIAEVAATVFFDGSLGDGFGGTSGFSIVEVPTDIYRDFVGTSDNPRSIEEKVDILLQDNLIVEYIATYVRLEDEKLKIILEAYDANLEWNKD